LGEKKKIKFAGIEGRFFTSRVINIYVELLPKRHFTTHELEENIGILVEMQASFKHLP